MQFERQDLNFSNQFSNYRTTSKIKKKGILCQDNLSKHKKTLIVSAQIKA